MRKLICGLGIISLLVVLAGCVPQPPVLTPIPELRTPGAEVGPPALRASWEGKWQTTLTEAKKEGKLNVYAIWKADVRLAVSQAFKDRYGISVEFSPFSRGEEMVTKVQAEQRAGLYWADVFGGGAGGTIGLSLREGGVPLGSMKPLLVLPEVLDPKVWRGGVFPFLDEEGSAIKMIKAVLHGVVYNTDLVKEGEITSIKDVLKPQYKGKLAWNDPSMIGTAHSFNVHLGLNVWGEEETVKFMKQLVTEQKAVIERDIRLHAESVARGKYAVGIGPNTELAAGLMASGAPIRLAWLEEDTLTIGSAGGIGVPTKFANPSAATVFVNWLLTKEGQSIFAEAFGSPSSRLDASTKGVNPFFIPQPDKEYYDGESAQFIAAKTKWVMIGKEIVQQAMK